MVLFCTSWPHFTTLSCCVQGSCEVGHEPGGPEILKTHFWGALILCESCPKMPYVTLCTFLAHNLAAKDDHKRPKRAWRPRGFFSQDCSREDERGVVGKPFREVLCYPIAKSTCLLIFSSFCMLFLFATCHRRIHEMLKTNLIGGNYGQLFLIDGPTEHALLNHPSARADFLPTLSNFGVGEVPSVMPPSQWSPWARILHIGSNPKPTHGYQIDLMIGIY